MYVSQIILVCCVVALAYCHNGHAARTSNDQLMKSLVFEESLPPKEVKKLLKNYPQPLAIKLASLSNYDISHCRLVPLDSMRVTISESWDSEKQHESVSLNNYLKYCETERKLRCALDGERVFTENEDDVAEMTQLLKSYGKSLNEEFAIRIKPYTLDSNIFPWLQYGRDVECRYKRDMIDKVVYQLEDACLMMNYIVNRRGMLEKSCKERAEDLKEEFLDGLNKAKQLMKRSTRGYLMRLVKRELGTPEDICERQGLRKEADALNEIKRRYNFKSPGVKFSALDNYSWEGLLKICESYTEAIGAKNVKKFISTNFKGKLNEKEIKWLAALALCHDILYETNKKEKPYHFHVETRVHSIAEKHNYHIAAKEGYYLDVIY